MKRSLLFAVPAAALLLLYVFSPLDPDGQMPPNRSQEGSLSPAGAIGREPILPLPAVPPLPSGKVALGDKLFHDPRLSHDDSIACASCHILSKGGVDQSRFSVGIYGAVGDVNAPTVFNSALNIAQFWDGRAGSLEEQAIGPVHNPVEMGSNWTEVIAKLRADKEYPALFKREYPDGISPANIAEAIATFERSLVTPNAKFDRHLRGEKDALSGEEQEGYRRFVNHGCVSCHQGVAVGGNMFQRFGVMGDYFKGRTSRKADMGRFNVTGLEEDRHVFKVPSLRNVAVTQPYFHDGSARTLSDAVRVMGKYQLGKDLSDEDVRLIVAFLSTLTGEWQGRVLK
ncbi:MAG TPA: cytochrome-c peroxidase [Gallionella sp.]|nr:cytochrome-c peroxidase [Gallionella sp.]